MTDAAEVDLAAHKAPLPRQPDCNSKAGFRAMRARDILMARGWPSSPSTAVAATRRPAAVDRRRPVDPAERRLAPVRKVDPPRPF